MTYVVWHAQGEQRTFTITVSKLTHTELPSELWRQIPVGVMEDVLRSTSQNVRYLERWHRCAA